MIGLLSNGLVARRMSNEEALRQALLMGLTPHVVGVVFLLLAIKHIVVDEDCRLDRARALGEAIQPCYYEIVRNSQWLK